MIDKPQNSIRKGKTEKNQWIKKYKKQNTNELGCDCQNLRVGLCKQNNPIKC